MPSSNGNTGNTGSDMLRFIPHGTLPAMVYVVVDGAEYFLPYDTFARLHAIPHPACDWCYGTGEVFTHSDDCRDDGCALAVGYHA